MVSDTVKCRVLLVDLQADFFDRRVPGLGRSAKGICLPSIRRLVRHAREHEWPITHAITVHDGQDSLPSLLRERGLDAFCVRGTAGSRIVGELFQDGDSLIEKQSFSAFKDKPPAYVGTESFPLVVAGVAVDCCVLLTVADAVNRYGRKVYLPYQAVSASDRDYYRVGLKMIAKSLAHVVDMEQLLSHGDPRSWKSLEVEAVDGAPADWFSANQQKLAGREREISEPSDGDDLIDRFERLLA